MLLSNYEIQLDMVAHASHAALRSLRQEDYESEARLGYTVTPSLKNKMKNYELEQRTKDLSKLPEEMPMLPGCLSSRT